MTTLSGRITAIDECLEIFSGRIMNHSEFVTIQSFDHRIQADLLLMVLHQRDIPARLADEHIVAMEWALANAIGGIKVQVPIAYASQAHEIASELQDTSTTVGNQGPAVDGDEACLSCGTMMSEDQSVCRHCGWSYDGE